MPAQIAERGDRAIPVAGFASLDVFCETGPGTASERCDWAPSTAPLAMPHPVLRVAAYRKEDTGLALTVKRNIPKAFRVLRMKLAAHMETAAKIAAIVMVVSSLWFGSHMLTVLRSAGSLSASALEAATHPVGSGVPSLSAVDVGSATEPSTGGTGPLSSVRRALVRRAAVEVTDTFASGMEAWGAAPKTWAKGWSHDPAGYVRPGDMALFRPSLGYKDYRLEFFGLVESKSLDWMVRARDSKNYTAMKFTTLEAGLRPIIAVAHYPVVGGQVGHRIETPLNVMVHNNTPYHVAVEVRGNRVVTSIEGQEVDSWTDDSLLASGGVGFFSEAGAKARLYWMKVYKNDDLLGRICAYLAGTGSGANTAELWGPGVPADPGRPTAPAPRDDAALAVVALGGVSGGARRGKISNGWRDELWS